MQKIFASLILAAVFLISSTSFAAYVEEIPEGANFGAVKKLAIGLPMHYKTDPTEPNVDDLIEVLTATSRLSKTEIISYDVIADNIWADKQLDIQALPDAEARKIFAENIGNYADAFVVLTTANNNKNIQFFFDVFDAHNPDQLLYRMSEQSRNFGRGLKGYTKACESFYKRFDLAKEKAVKEAEKAAKKAAKQK